MCWQKPHVRWEWCLRKSHFHFNGHWMIIILLVLLWPFVVFNLFVLSYWNFKKVYYNYRRLEHFHKLRNCKDMHSTTVTLDLFHYINMQSE